MTALRTLGERAARSVVLALFVWAAASPALARAPSARPTAATGLTGEGAKVLVLPVVVRVPVRASGKFSGLAAGALVERFHLSSHARFVAAFAERAAGRILPAAATAKLLDQRDLKPAQAQSPEALRALAEAAQVLWIVQLDLDKEGTLHARVVGDDGSDFGLPRRVQKARALSGDVARTLAALVLEDLGPPLGLDGAGGTATSPSPAVDVASEPGPVALEAEGPAEGVDQEQSAPGLAAEAPRPPSRARPRLSLLAGSGASLRAVAVTGSGADALARLETGPIAFLGATARVAPLQLFAATADGRWTDFELELRYRRGLAKAQVTAGPTAGEPCSVSDDELGARAAWRAKLGEGRWPWLGAAVGWSAQQTRFRCAAPVLSAEWRGVDVQLRYQQPILGELLALDVAVGPHFPLVAQPPGASPLSFSGEAWLELKPASLLFVRAGARVAAFRATVSGLALRDSRTVAALEAGVFY